MVHSMNEPKVGAFRVPLEAGQPALYWRGGISQFRWINAFGGTSSERIWRCEHFHNTKSDALVCAEIELEGLCPRPMHRPRNRLGSVGALAVFSTAPVTFITYRTQHFLSANRPRQGEPTVSPNNTSALTDSQGHPFECPAVPDITVNELLAQVAELPEFEYPVSGDATTRQGENGE